MKPNSEPNSDLTVEYQFSNNLTYNSRPNR